MERKLHLVPPPQEGSPRDADEEHVSAEERAEAEALRAALDRGEDPLAAALQAAFAPCDAAGDDLDAILARAMGDESASTEAERDAADRLRVELAGEAEVREAAILMALKVAADPPALPEGRNEALVNAALFRAKKRSTLLRLVPFTMAAAAGLSAVAAAFAFYLSGAHEAPAPAAVAAATLIPARSTQELFDAATPFPRRGEESARIDRIAAARKADLRANRFAAWGVR
jgi:hypothetical protein